MAWKHRLQNTGTSAVSWGSSGAGIGSLFGPQGAAIGAGIGTGIGALVGLLSDTEQQELAEKWANGELDEATVENITRMLSDRFDQLRKQQGGRLARSGIANSSIGERMMADTYDNERDALAEALANQTFARQQLGLGMMGQQSAERAETWGGSVDNIMGVVSGLKADERWESERADLKQHRSNMMKLAQDRPLRLPMIDEDRPLRLPMIDEDRPLRLPMIDEGGAAPAAPVSSHQAKAAVMAGTMPKGRGRGASGGRPWGDLIGSANKQRSSVMQSRQGGGSYSNRGANPSMSGSRQRKSWF